MVYLILVIIGNVTEDVDKLGPKGKQKTVYVQRGSKIQRCGEGEVGREITVPRFLTPRGLTS